MGGGGGGLLMKGHPRESTRMKGYPREMTLMKGHLVEVVERDLLRCVCVWGGGGGGGDLLREGGGGGSRLLTHSEHRFPIPPFLKEGCRKPVFGVWVVERLAWGEGGGAMYLLRLAG